MIVTTTDPITRNPVTDLNDAPFVLEGKGQYALKIYFESEASKQAYLAITLHTPDYGVPRPYAEVSGIPASGAIN